MYELGTDLLPSKGTNKANASGTANEVVATEIEETAIAIEKKEATVVASPTIRTE